MYSIEDENRNKGLKLGYRQRITANRQSPRLLVGLLLVLVLLLHLWLALWLSTPRSVPVKPKPVIIEVSLLPTPAKQMSIPRVAQPSPAPVIKPPPASKPKPVKSKPVVKSPPKEKVVEKKAMPEPKPMAEPTRAEPVPQPASASTPSIETAKPAAQAAPVIKSASGTTTSSKEIPRATCVSCPKPNYPAIARRRGWQGSVLLRFELTPDGLARNISVESSSGHELLDEAAIANAKESRFTTGEPGVIRAATKLFNFKLN